MPISPWPTAREGPLKSQLALNLGGSSDLALHTRPGGIHGPGDLRQWVPSRRSRVQINSALRRGYGGAWAHPRWVRPFRPGAAASQKWAITRRRRRV